MCVYHALFVQKVGNSILQSISTILLGNLCHNWGIFAIFLVVLEKLIREVSLRILGSKRSLSFPNHLNLSQQMDPDTRHVIQGKLIISREL